MLEELSKRDHSGEEPAPGVGDPLKELSDANVDRNDSEQNLEGNVGSQLIYIDDHETHKTVSDDLISSDKGKPAAKSLDGLEEIVKSPEASNDELPSREEIIDELAHIIEAIIFASDEPLSVGTIKSVLDASHTFGRVNPDMIVSRIDALNDKYGADGSGFRIIEIAEGYQFATRKELAQWISYLFREKARRKLSNSALETLAIIAYKQPVTKPEIESIRGVNVDYVLHNLLEKEIVTVVGRGETVGRPLLYGTTQRFLKIFGLRNLEDLPKLREIEEIIKEIRSKGAEESIQLEITALGDEVATEPMSPTGSGTDASSDAPSKDKDAADRRDTSLDDASPKA